MKKELDVLRGDLAKYRPQFEVLLKSSGIPTDRFIQATVVAAMKNPEIMRCDKSSVFLAIFESARMGILPDGQRGAIVAFNSKHNVRKVASFFPMVRGIVELLLKDNSVQSIYPEVVYKGENFTFRIDSREKDGLLLTHERDFFSSTTRKDEDIVGAYCLAKLSDGSSKAIAIGMDIINRARRHAKKDTFWKTHFDEMCKKTAIHRISKTMNLDPSGHFEKVRANIEAGFSDPSVAIGPPVQEEIALDDFAKTLDDRPTKEMVEEITWDDGSAEEIEKEVGV